MTPSIFRAPSEAAVEAFVREWERIANERHPTRPITLDEITEARSEVKRILPAAHAITVREVLDALVGGAPETLPKDERGCTIYPPLVRALALEVNDLLAKGDCPHGPECECVGSIGDGVMWAMLHRASRALLPDAPKGGG